MSQLNSKAISIGYLTKVSVGDVNASHTEGNIMVTKKVTLPDGSTIPYISGQAVRRMLRDRLEDLGYELSEPFARVDKQEVIPPVQPWKFADEDLFGYLDPSGMRRRTSPVRVPAAVGLFRYKGDRDLGTRSFEKFGQGLQQGGNMFETEIYQNLFRNSILIELDRLGLYKSRYELIPSSKKPKATDREKEEEQSERTKREELKGSSTEVEEEQYPFKGFRAVLGRDERQKRLEILLDALEFLWGGGRTARMLADLSPRFLAYAHLTVKHPVFLEALSVHYEDGGYLLDLDLLVNELEKFSAHQKKILFGLEPSFFENEADIRKKLGEYGEILTVDKTIQKAKEDTKTIWKSS